MRFSQAKAPQARGDSSVVKVGLFALLISALLLATAHADAECTVNPHDGTSTCVEQPVCGVYMAPSTLGEDTNMGIYTGMALKKDDIVNFPEIAIPLLFREWGEHKEGYDGACICIVYLYCVVIMMSAAGGVFVVKISCFSMLSQELPTVVGIIRIFF